MIPKAARDLFHIRKNDSLVILGDEQEGIAIMKAEIFEQKLNQAWEHIKDDLHKAHGGDH